jgi:broad-specificity NMP kinase
MRVAWLRERNTIVHINGCPGTGKLTIARLLAPMIGAKLVDNHTLINPAEMLFARRDPLYRSLREGNPHAGL